MKFLCISDTHNEHNGLLLPPADVIIHAGDATTHGTEEECIAFLDWFRALDYEYKIYVPGNHDKWIIRHNQEMDLSGLNVLFHDEMMINGIRIIGTCQKDERVLERFTFAPNPSILITHYPPKRILDSVDAGTKNYKATNGFPEFLGNRTISDLVSQLKPAVHIFGHVHEWGGHDVVLGSTHYFNVAVFDEYYRLVRPGGRVIEVSSEAS